MERGWYRLPRGWMDNPLFEKTPLTEREAWAWLIENARYKPGQVVLRSGASIPAERGSVLVSQRGLAEAWQWSRQRVRTFLKKLARARMVTRLDTRSCAHQLTHLKICAYEQIYGGGEASRPGAQPPRQPARQPGAQPGPEPPSTHIPPIQEKEKKAENGQGGGPARGDLPPRTDEAAAHAAAGPSGRGADGYAWQGAVVRLSADHYRGMFDDFCARVQRRYRTRETFEGVLADADAYFAGEPEAERRRWWFRLRKWIEREIQTRYRPLSLNEIAG